MLERDITIDTADGAMDAFVALPEGPGPHPAVVVAMEAFGVNDHIRDVCKRFAKAGIAALAPELYHRDARGLTFAYDDLPKAREHLREVTNDGLTMDVTASIAALRATPEIDPKRVGMVGFCMGGFVAFLAACRADVASTVVYYGGGIVSPRPGFKMTPTIGEADRIARPVLGLFGAEDASIPQADVDAIRARLTELGKEHEIVVYEGAGHGFSCDPRASFHREAAADAWSRTLAWLARTMPSE